MMDLLTALRDIRSGLDTIRGRLQGAQLALEHKEKDVELALDQIQKGQSTIAVLLGD